MDQTVRNTKIGKMTATGMSRAKIAEAITKRGDEPITPAAVARIQNLPSVRDVIEKERDRLAALVPQAVTNYEHWIKNAKMFHCKEDKDIAFKATTKVLESHGVVSGPLSEQVKITITKEEVTLSPVIEKIISGFMSALSEAKPAEASSLNPKIEIIDVVPEQEENQEEISEKS